MIVWCIKLSSTPVVGMLKDYLLARSIADMGFGAFRRQVEYQAAQRGKTVMIMNSLVSQQQNLFSMRAQNAQNAATYPRMDLPRVSCAS